MTPQDKSRFTRIAVALALCGIVVSQLPQNPSVALADDGYIDAGGGLLGLGGGVSLKTAAVAGVAVGAISNAGRAGTVSVVNSPLLTRAAPIYDVTNSLPDEFSEITKIVRNAERIDSYREAGPYTVFWPTNATLTKALGAGTVARLQSVAGKSEAQALLARLTVKGSYSLQRLQALGSTGTILTTLSGDSVVLKSDKGTLTANGVEILQSEHPATNGFVLATNGLIVPEDPQP